MTVLTRILTASVAFAVGISVLPALAQNETERTIEQYSCKDLMRESGGPREIAIAFLHGYLLGKSGTSKFNLATLEKQTDAFVEYCLDHPADKAEAAMTQSKK